jgi:hypothetical protein
MYNSDKPNQMWHGKVGTQYKYMQVMCKPAPVDTTVDGNVFDFEGSSYDLEGVDIQGKYVRGDTTRACDSVCGDLGLICNTESKSEDSVVAEACATVGKEKCWCEGELAFKRQVVKVDVLTPEALDKLIPETVAATTTLAPTTTAAPTTTTTEPEVKEVKESEESEESEPKLLGCFRDRRNRDLPKRTRSFRAGNEEQCFKQCKEAGFKYAGLQWRGQCFCGNEYGKHGETKGCNCKKGSRNFGGWKQCVFDLAADTAEVKEAEPEVVEESSEASEPELLGCFRDRRNRDLPKRTRSFRAGNEQQCFEQCREAGFKYAGLQWRGQCFCGNDYGKHGKTKGCNCKKGSRNFGGWKQCVFDLAADKALLV